MTDEHFHWLEEEAMPKDIKLSATIKIVMSYQLILISASCIDELTPDI